MRVNGVHHGLYRCLRLERRHRFTQQLERLRSDDVYAQDFAITPSATIFTKPSWLPRIVALLLAANGIFRFSRDDPARAPAPRLAPHCRYPAPYMLAGNAVAVYRPHGLSRHMTWTATNPCMSPRAPVAVWPATISDGIDRPVRRFAATHSLHKAAVELDL